MKIRIEPLCGEHPSWGFFFFQGVKDFIRRLEY
jgi:hypothetical protein